MSLVNDMLRDLDQRRKESGDSNGAVKLTPAADYPEDKRKILLPLVLFALLLTSGSIWYYWDQLQQSGIEQQLDIQLQPALANSDIPPIENVEEESEPAQIESSEPVIEETPEAIEEETVIAAVEETPDPTDAPPRSAVLAADNRTSSLELARDEPELESEPAAAVTPDLPLDQTIPSSNEIVKTSEEAVVNSLAEPASSSDVSATEPEAEAAIEIVDIVSPVNSGNALVDPIRDEPAFTTEQQDTIAVQEALDHIANGQTAEAYAVLGEHIASNGYAHQSRETYAKLLMSRGEVQEAYALIEAGLRLAPNHRGFKKVKARLLMANGLIGEAADLSISRAPDVTEDSEYHDLLATAQLSSKDYEGASISYRGLVEQDPSQGKWWYGYAASQDNLGNTDAARRYYLQAIQYSNLSASLRRRSQERLSVLNP